MYFYLMCIGVLTACMSLHHVYGLPTEARRGPMILQNWIDRGCETPYRCRELNPGPLKSSQGSSVLSLKP